MAVDFHEEASEWVTETQTTIPRMALPPADSDYAYAAARLFSWYPVINSRGATYEPEDFNDELLGTLIGKQANLEHDKSKVVGSIFEYDVNGEGIDVGIRIDREQAALHDLDIESMRSGNYFSHVSVELTKDPEQSYFYAYDDGYNVKKRIPVLAGRQANIRRTTARDPFNLMGYKVAERIKPKRFTGVGFVPRPADKTAELYAVAASDDDGEDILQNLDLIEILGEDWATLVAEEGEQGSKDFLTPGGAYADPGWQSDGKKRYPLDTHGHVISAARFFGRAENRSKYSAAHIKSIDAKIAAAKKRYGIGDTSESASTTDKGVRMSAEEAQALTNKVAELERQVEALTTERETASSLATAKAERVSALEAELVSAQTELASANDQLTALRCEKEVAAKNTRVDAFVTELEGILTCGSDDERTALREKAAEACDDETKMTLLRLQRQNDALTAKNVTLEAEKASAAAAAGAAGAAAGKETEQAGEEFEVADDPLVAAGANLSPDPQYRGHKVADLLNLV